MEDLEFSNRMLKRRIKIDVRSQGQPEAVRARLREQLIEEYFTYRPTRMLFFVQKVRLMVLKRDLGVSEESLELLQLQKDSPENIIAQSEHTPVSSSDLPNRATQLVQPRATPSIIIVSS